MKKTILGIPVSIIAVGLTLLLVGGAVLAAWAITKPMPCTVMVLGSDITIYEDVACTTELTELDFGEIGQGASSVVIPMYVKNTGDYTVYVGLSTSATEGEVLDPELTLKYDSLDIVIPVHPDIYTNALSWTLAPGGEITVPIVLYSSESCTRGDKSFILQVHGQDIPY